MHILIVEDEEKLRRAMIRMLDLHGHTTCWASTGEGALRLLRTESIDLMLLDMKLPDRSGWDVRRDQLAEPAMAGIPVIIISGLDAEAMAASGRVNTIASVQLIMSKPVDGAQLLAAIEHIEELGKFR